MRSPPLRSGYFVNWRGGDEGLSTHDRVFGLGQRRQQYLSDAILSRLRPMALPAGRLLGLVDLDLYTPGLNFVFGQASMGGREALFALARLRQSFYGLPDDEALFHERAIKEAVHELGHTYRLGHCPDATCVMHFSNSLPDTDSKGKEFCVVCQAALTELYQIPATPTAY